MEVGQRRMGRGWRVLGGTGRGWLLSCNDVGIDDKGGNGYTLNKLKVCHVRI